MAQFHFAGQTGFYQGKVRDVYTIAEGLVIMIASDRISAFDVVLPRLIPFKGQVLNEIAAYMLDNCRDICPNWLLSVPAPSASIGKKCIPFQIEMVIRGNLTGHAWRTYNSGTRTLCGVEMPADMKENDFFPQPLITPSTKEHAGHDEDISGAEIISKGLATEYDWAILQEYTHRLFERGKKLAAEQGLILADTKYEFGKIGDIIYLMDEIHTPDSSRYFYAEGFKERLLSGEKQKQLSKEFVREWLMENGFSGKEGQEIPVLTDDKVREISARYIELYEKITGRKFIPRKIESDTLFEMITNAVETLKG